MFLSFFRKGIVLLSINHLIICFIESFIELGFLKCAYLWLIWSGKWFYWESGELNHFQERVSYNIWCVNPHSLHSTLFRRGNVLIPEHLISLLIFSSQSCVSCSQLWVVFLKLFVPLVEQTPRLDPLYPCAWQTKFLSASFQFVVQRSFHVPLLKICNDPLDGKPFFVGRRTEKSRKKSRENFG